MSIIEYENLLEEIKFIIEFTIKDLESELVSNDFEPFKTSLENFDAEQPWLSLNELLTQLVI